jgi:hypothetical protein
VVKLPANTNQPNTVQHVESKEPNSGPTSKTKDEKETIHSEKYADQDHAQHAEKLEPKQRTGKKAPDKNAQHVHP